MRKGFIVKIVIALFLLGSVITQKMELGARILGIVIAAALIAWALLPLRKRSAGISTAAPVQQGGTEKYRFTVAGLSYRMDAFYSVAQRHKDFGLGDADFIRKHSSGRAVYEWNLKRGSKVELVPEPANEHDPNAIAVYVDGAHVGYVPADETEDVQQLLAVPHFVRGWVGGGASKKVEDGRVVTKASDINLYVEISQKEVV